MLLEVIKTKTIKPFNRMLKGEKYILSNDVYYQCNGSKMFYKEELDALKVARSFFMKQIIIKENNGKKNIGVDIDKEIYGNKIEKVNVTFQKEVTQTFSVYA
jgi:hypothetical protein